MNKEGFLKLLQDPEVKRCNECTFSMEYCEQRCPIHARARGELL